MLAKIVKKLKPRRTIILNSKKISVPDTYQTDKNLRLKAAYELLGLWADKDISFFDEGKK